MLFLDEVSAISGGAAAFAKEAMKEINVFLEEYPGRFVFVIADYAEKIDEFLRLDHIASK